MINWIIVAIAIEIVITGAKLFRIGLEEAAELGLIHPVAIVVELQVAQPFPARKQKPVPNDGIPL